MADNFAELQTAEMKAFGLSEEMQLDILNKIERKVIKQADTLNHFGNVAELSLTNAISIFLKMLGGGDDQLDNDVDDFRKKRWHMPPPDTDRSWAEKPYSGGPR